MAEQQQYVRERDLPVAVDVGDGARRRYADPKESPRWPEVPPGEAVPLCPADLDDDGFVGVADLLRVLATWGEWPK